MSPEDGRPSLRTDEKLVVRVADVEDWPEGVRVAQWTSLFARDLAHFELHALTAPLRARMVEQDFRCIRLTEINISPSRFKRSEELVRDAYSDPVQFVILLEGEFTLRQGGRTADVKTGEACLADPTSPSEVTMTSQCRLLIVHVPQQHFTMSAKKLSSLAAVRIASNTPMLHVVVRLLRDLVEQDAPRVYESQREEIGRAVVLLLQALVNRLRPEMALQAPGRSEAIRSDIDRLLGDERLTPSWIAARHHISTRFLHRLFESEPLTVAAYIRAKRMEGAAKDLLDPALHDLTIAEIGSRWGVPEPSRFSQLFRLHFGMTPRAYRHAVA